LTYPSAPAESKPGRDEGSGGAVEQSNWDLNKIGKGIVEKRNSQVL